MGFLKESSLDFSTQQLAKCNKGEQFPMHTNNSKKVVLRNFKQGKLVGQGFNTLLNSGNFSQQ